MKKMMIGIVAAMMVFGTTAMNAQNMGNGRNNNHGNNHGYVTNDNGHNGGNYGGYHGDNYGGNHGGNYGGNHGGDYHMGNGHMGYGHGMDREMMKVREICHRKDVRSMDFRWTRRAIRAHGNMDRHMFVREIVKGHHTGHMVCTVCGYHVH